MANASPYSDRSALLHRSALVIAQFGPLTPAAMADEAQSLGRTEVVGTAPLPGIGTPIEQVPSNIQVFGARDLARQRTSGVAEYLDLNANSISLDTPTGNSFQPDVSFRGFTASSLLGTPQGMSVFQDGVRINEAFADVVNWDLLPKSAVASMQRLPGSSPIFGLSTLGGALTIAMKDGLAQRGLDLQASAGSFGRTELAPEAGGNDGRFGFCVAAEDIDDSGCRDHSSSRIRRMYARGDAHAGEDEFGVGVTLADNHLEGTQALPVSMFGDPRQAYTWPDTTKNRLLFVNANRQRIDNLFDTALQNFGILGANCFRGPGGTYSTTLVVPEPFRAPGSAFGAWIGVRYALAE